MLPSASLGTSKCYLFRTHIIGTIDQAILGVLNVRHSSVRAFGLAGKVIILDEVHSYDQYTGTLIQDFINLICSLGATVIILSATLRIAAKKEFLGLANEYHLTDSYPCITSCTKNGLKEISTKDEGAKEIELIHEENDYVAFDSAISDVCSGKYVLWIENDVLSAQKTYLLFSARLSEKVDSIGLIHSRFVNYDRMQLEKVFIPIFAKSGISKRNLSSGFILIGTQIVEQSLDIDADVIYSRLAPADMLFQRSGRLWRHNIPNRKGHPVLHLLHAPLKKLDNDLSLFGRSGYVYSPYVLYCTLKVMEGRKKLRVPDDVKDIIEQVYGYPENNLTNTIKNEKYKLEEYKKKLHLLAKESEVHIGGILSENVTTRYSSEETVNVFIFAGFNLPARSIQLINGEIVYLTRGSARERAEISYKLESAMVKVPSKKIKEGLIDSSVVNLLKDYLYISQDSDENPRIFVLENENLKDLSGNFISGCHYSGKIGYFISEEVFRG